MEKLFYEKIALILERAHCADKKCELFGASKHQYRLNPPINESVVHAVEEKYNFQFPEDYFHFITKVANGGAGPDYGIMTFEESLMTGAYSDFQKAYQCSLSKSFIPRRMLPDEVENYAFSKSAYEQNPDKFFIYEKEDDDICNTDGFFVLGTHGCQWDFGLIVSGERKGQVFDTDNEGGYVFISHSFTAFYQNWLDWLSDTENIQRELERWRKFSTVSL